MICFLNGKFLNEEKALISPLDNGFYYGDGVYETMRTAHGIIWQLEKHLKRLEQSANLINLNIPWPKQQISAWLDKIIEKNGLPESRIRLTISRGELNLNFKKKTDPSIFIRVESLKPEPKEIYSQGVDIITISAERFLSRAKTLNMLPMIMAFQKAQEVGAYEALYINKLGYVTEGAITNYFIVKNHILLTPENDILLGTTRDFILDIAKKEKLKVVLKNLKLEDIYKADECFICNAPRGIVPVKTINNKRLPSTDFNITQLLRSKFPF